ncbi:chromosome segregation SMC family protein [Polycladidibacter hongkongensis]|uniref:chromosome segregation SMC family protein n=1 Tax=Polycladidibacter hongkongensis TaxID=1647556 RepID=UPI0008340228|nr:AAA family ATPase [Pseudovibrio hongkongensis]
MKFQRLRIIGFKSFVEPMEFVIEDGLTGVVGPNGCGKSNLVEALRWVMGENSYKNMRASGMDDVIFSGSLNRPARNTAEVTVFLDNDSQSGPEAFAGAQTLEVTRRIEREAGSVYKMNGKDVRARDVQLLFADASTGARSPSMVRQGQIGEMISAKPTARRKVLEEAAGISGLHSRRNEAEIRLRAAETNLERLEDVLTQLDTQVDSLKRQARQASRYRNLSSDIRRAEATILYLRWQEATAALDSARKAFAEANAALADISGTQAAAAKEQAIAAHKLPQMRDAAASTGAAHQRLVIASKEMDAEERRIKTRLAELEGRMQQLQEDIAREQALQQENDSYLEELGEEELELQQLEEGAQAQAEELEERVGDAAQDLAAAEAAESAATQAQAQMAALQNQLQQKLEREKARQQRFADQARALQSLLQGLQEEIDRARQNGEHLEELEMAREELAELEEQLIEAESAVDTAQKREVAARGPLADARQRLTSAQSEAATLSSILAAAAVGDWPPLADQLTVQAGYEMALGAALGDDLELPLAEDAPAFWGGCPMSSGDPDLPSGAEPLSKFVKAPVQASRRLQQIGVVAQTQGDALQPDLATGQRLVSREGDLWRWDGLRLKPDAPTAAAQRLAQRNRLAELQRVLEELEAAAEAAANELESAANALGVARTQEQSQRTALKLQQGTIARLQEQLAATQRAIAALEVKEASAREQLARLAEEQADCNEALEETVMQLEELPDMQEQQLRLSQAVAATASARAQLAEAKLALQGLSQQKQQRTARIAAIARERQNWVQRAENAGRQLETLQGRAQETREEREMLLEAPEEIELKRQELLSAISAAEEAKREADTALQEAERRQIEADRRANEALEGLAGARERKIRAEERLQAAKERRSDTEHHVLETLDVGVGELARLAEIKADAPLPDMAAQEKRLERLKNERERLGGVNLRAEEEMQELGGQITTLTNERDDLIEAIKKLRSAIANLNKEARERLLNSFDEVNNHFQRLFTHLFGGGTAELKLVDSEDPLDAGLEIFARPPGKKPQTMTLLSGGEQALTAMALIFAVFLTNPAPICVLDEVDAPLDDANVERYCALLEEMSTNTSTRFVVITHNPITMARMNRLFGVTMAERGVSQLVSVDLETAERFIEAS